MKKYVIAGMAFCLVVGFQNCSKNNFSDMNTSDALNNPLVATPIEKLDVSQTETVEIPESPLLESKLEADMLQAKSSFASHHLEIDVKTGVIHVVEDGNNEVISGIQYCLNDQQLYSLTSILSSSKICQEKIPSSSPNQVCTMQYKFPYAKLHIANSEPVSLGEVFNACSSGFDLCGEQKARLQAYLGELQTNLSTLKCDFQVVKQ